nr:TetR/AcrR family transcriptional regulator [uncultured bacterium]
MSPLEKRQEIVKAARECFARFGYDKTTLDDIGRIVGLNKASLYYYYKNKEAIFVEVIVQEIESCLDHHCAKIKELPGCREKILSYLREKIRYMQNLINVHNLSIEAFRNVQPMFANLFQQITEKEVIFISGIFDECIACGDMKPCNTKRVARTLLTVIDGIKIKAVQGTDPRFIENLNIKALEDEVVFTVSLILDGLMNTSQ